jgi:3-hydroxyacyl-CoA dehydrogenase/enoyl-CoA hydratase/3-hydroxybutyryl-CoA epimerase
MIDNSARQAGMPVGPLALTDEIGVDLAWKILQATKKRRRAPRSSSTRRRRGLWRRWWCAASVSGRKNGKGFYDYQGREKALWPGLADLSRPARRAISTRTN